MPVEICLQFSSSVVRTVTVRAKTTFVQVSSIDIDRMYRVPGRTPKKLDPLVLVQQASWLSLLLLLAVFFYLDLCVVVWSHGA